MAALTMQDQDDYPAFVAWFQGSHRLVTTYLLDEVFARESQVVRTFLLRTSILERLSATLCDAVVRVETGGGAQDEKPRMAPLPRHQARKLLSDWKSRTYL